MMAVTRLIEPESLKVLLGITYTDSEDDARLIMACDAATSMIQAACDRQFIAETTATARVFVASTPWVCQVDDISTTTDLVVRTDEDDDGVFETTWATTDYQLEPLNGRLSGQAWPYTTIRAIESREWPFDYGRALVQVTARWGWSATDATTTAYLPSAVVQAAQIQATSLYKSAEAPLGIAGFGDIGIMRLRQALHPVATALLAPYRRDPVLVA
jgi:hypothetical protein